AEIQLSHAFGTSETSERNSGMEIIYGTRTISGTETTCRTISGIETIICGVTGKNTFSLTPQGIGIAIGTAIATTGGMVTDAVLLMERGLSSVWDFLRGGLRTTRTTRTITSTTMAFRMMAMARRPTGTLIRTRTITPTTTQAITRDRCITKIAIPT